MKRRWLAALSVGYILVFFSEFLFVNIYDGFDLAGVIPMWLVYSLEAYILLAIIAHYRVRNWAALFLAGAVYGWLLEGIVVQTMYAVFPFQIAFTGLSWHALLDVLVGVYLLRYVMHTQTARQTAQLAVMIGLFWGFWAVCWWTEGYTLLTPVEFALFAFGTTLPLLPAYWAWNHVTSFVPNKRMVRLLIALHSAVFIVVVLMIPYAVLVLPPLLWLIWRALRHHRASTAPDTLRILFKGRVGVWHYAALLLIPAIATGEYALLLTMNIRIASNAIIAAIAVPISVGLFGWALWKLRNSEFSETGTCNSLSIAH